MTSPSLPAEWKRIVEVLKRRVGQAAASDIAQEAYLFALEKGNTSYRYVLRVAKFKMFEYWKKNRRNCGDEALEHSSAVDPWEHIKIESWEQKVCEQVERLDPKYKDVLYRIASGDKSQEQIAKEMSLSPAAVRKRAQRARQSVCAALGVLTLLLMIAAFAASLWEACNSSDVRDITPTDEARAQQPRPSVGLPPSTLERSIPSPLESAEPSQSRRRRESRDGGGPEAGTAPHRPAYELDQAVDFAFDGVDTSEPSAVGRAASPSFTPVIGFTPAPPGFGDIHTPTPGGQVSVPEGARRATPDAREPEFQRAPGRTVVYPFNVHPGDQPRNSWIGAAVALANREPRLPSLPGKYPVLKAVASGPPDSANFEQLLTACAEVEIALALTASDSLLPIRAGAPSALQRACLLAEVAHDRFTSDDVDASAELLELAIEALDLESEADSTSADERPSHVELAVSQEAQRILDLLLEAEPAE